jgi:hypothetical protein
LVTQALILNLEVVNFVLEMVDLRGRDLHSSGRLGELSEQVFHVVNSFH